MSSSHQESVSQEPTQQPEQSPQPRVVYKNPEWALKPITWPPSTSPDAPKRSFKIITQNHNGPCSFIAICNILILRGDIQIAPPERTSASYEYLSGLVADYLVSQSSDVDLTAALSILPSTQEGMDLNPLFTGVSSFRPAGDGGALKLFNVANIRLVHGWLVDPESPEYSVLSVTEDYDNSVNAIIDADHITKGQLVTNQDEEHRFLEAEKWTPEERKKVQDALLIDEWLKSNPTQLTYHGLFSLSTALKPGELAALFRGSHLSVLYRRQVDDISSLYTLSTDHIFANETSVVWESFGDVDGQGSSFFDSDFFPASPAGGDFAGRTAESTLRALEAREEDAATAADRALARQLQAEEDAHARHVYNEQLRAQHQAEARLQQATGGSSERYTPKANQGVSKKKSKGDCIIM